MQALRRRQKRRCSGIRIIMILYRLKNHVSNLEKGPQRHAHGGSHFVAAVLPKLPTRALELGDMISLAGVLRALFAGFTTRPSKGSGKKRF